MSLKQKTVLFSLFCLAFLVSAGGYAFATEVNWPTSPLTGITLGSDSEFHDFASYLYGWGIGIGGLLVFIMVVIAGVEWMTSLDNPKQKQRALSRIYSAVLGLVLLLSTFLILNTINPQLTRLTPLPSLWEDDMFSEMDVPEEYFANVPPCEFTYLYPERNFGGSPSRVTPGRYSTSLDYESGMGFAKITERERRMLEQGDTSFAYKGMIIDNNYFASTGSCILIVFHQPGPFWDKEERELAGIPLPNDNFFGVFGEEQEVSSYEIEDGSVGEI